MAGGIEVPGDWDDWRWAGRGRNTGPTIPPFDNLNSTGIFCWQFTNGDELHFSDLQISHDYAEGTDIIPHIHWCPTTTGAYTGTWTLDIVGWPTVHSGTPLSDVQTVTVPFDDSLTAFQMQSHNFSADISGVGRKISSILHLKLSLSLTAGTRCALAGLDGHYQKNRLGSRETLEK